MADGNALLFGVSCFSIASGDFSRLFAGVLGRHLHYLHYLLISETVAVSLLLFWPCTLV